jgi:hypothetical protein
MTDERLQELLDDAARTYRPPPEPELDAMWAVVERDAFDRRRAWRVDWIDAPAKRLFIAGIAAALLVGVAVGRYSARQGAATESAVATADSVNGRELPDAYQPTATELLGRTAVLLSNLPSEATSSAGDRRFSAQASELLSTTRLLLDSPAADDRRFKELLEDLELVLAQIARLNARDGHEEIDLITDALVERDVMPRIRSTVARLAAGDD